MLANPTTLIVGAGASVELGYPTGSQLRDWIIEGRGLDANLSFGEDAPEYRKELTVRLKGSLIPSIDAFLAEAENRDLHSWGVLCIAAALLPQEQKNKTDPPSWLRYIFNAIRGARSDERHHKLKIVTFNYDLSIEFFLFNAFKSAYRLDQEAARKRFEEAVEVIHVYGHLGQLAEFGGEHLYGGAINEGVINRARKSLKIIGRAPADQAFNSAHLAIQEADFVAILGFGFDETNLANLRLLELAKDKYIISTGYGFGAGMRGWVHNLGFENLMFSKPIDTVSVVLEKSAFFQWANSAGRKAEDMYTAIYRGRRMLPDGE